MQSFILTTATVAILASQAEALMQVGLVAKTAFGDATSTTHVTASVNKWGYDAAAVYYTMSTTATYGAAVLAVVDNNQAAVWAAISGATDVHFYFGCQITIDTTSTYKGVWEFYSVADTVPNFDGAAAVAMSAQATITPNTTLKTLSTASASTAFGTEITLAADKNVVKQTILAGSTMKLASDRATLDCMTKIKFTQDNLAKAVISSALGATSVKGGMKWVGQTRISGTYKIEQKVVTLVNPVVADAVATASSSKYSGAGAVVTGIASTTNAVDIWTSTATVLANFDFTMTLSAASAAKTYEQATCTQLLTAKWMCVVASCLGKAAAVGTWTMKAYSSVTKPALSDTTALLATDDLKNFTNKTIYIPEFLWKGTNISPALKGSDANNLDSENFAWSATGNTWASKVISSSLQYKETFASTTAADAIVVTMKAYQVLPVSCAATDLSSAVSACSAKAMTAPAVTAAAVVAGALSMATVGAAVAALAIAF